MFYTWLKKFAESANHEDWPNMLNAIHPSTLRQYGKSYNADMTPRLVGADFLDDLGRGEEAALLRDPNKHVYRHDGKIHDAHQLSQQFHGANPRDGSRAAGHGLNSEERGYLQTALWSENDDEGDPFNTNYSTDDIHPATLAAMVSDWRSFKDHATSLGLLGEDPDERAPHDFWLSRGGHGTGFFAYPEYYGEEQAKALQQLAKRYGEYNLLVGDDGMIHGYAYHVSPPPKPKPKKKRKK